MVTFPYNKKGTKKENVLVTEDTQSTASLTSPSDSESLGFGSVSSVHIFNDSKVADYYFKIYDDCKYECRKYFDPKFQWTASEERKVVRKVDLRVAFWAMWMFAALNIDRNNLSQALSDNFLDDVGLTTADYNLGNTVNLVCFILAEMPAQLISKKIGPDRWVPFEMIAWSIVAMSQAAIKNRSGFLATRALLGMLEGGFIADTVLWLSYFYTGSELTIRLGYFYVSGQITTIVMSLVAYGLLQIRAAGMGGWQWLFVVEGLFTFIIGVMSYFLMSPSVSQTKAWFRPKGSYTEREVKIVVNKLLRDDPAKGEMNNRQAVSFKKLLTSLADYNLWPMYLLSYLACMGLTSTSSYLTLILRKLGFSTVNTILLTIPKTAGAALTLLLMNYLASATNQTLLVAMLEPIWVIPCAIALRWWPGLNVNVWATFALLNVALSYPACYASLLALVSKNSNSVRNRTISQTIMNIMAQLSAITCSNLYQPHDAPLYHKGNEILLGLNVATFVALGATRYYYSHQNQRREKIWNSMDSEQQELYLQNSEQLGTKRLDFRFSL
ncbi:hypothetical protein HG535_0B00210 [Zygotorulaspora mrakii]|uniref:Major facilitator superfamily (MFS) profile domain-containing protein n=1 Tax=Zygotorulaspora mrakii TaxID=42260 RepID=A0A7H9AY07_ZYGMR|nr:uncharacterized protein HG535_0B00210 [Zygotorulaspora mrakii]QLG70984.1 hypothetical protein HG535_0B00210 [Zygotorulaspora mrakii]